MTTLTIYAFEHFHASQSKAGFASSIFLIGAVISRPLAGKYMEVIGRKNLIYSSLLLFLIAELLYFPASSLTLLLAIRFIHGAAFGIANTVMTAVAMDLIPHERCGEGTSYFALSPTAATALGPFIGLLITQHAEYKFIFVTCTILSVMTLMIMLFLKIPEANITKEQLQTLKSGFKIQDFFESKAVPISLMMVLVGIAYSGIVSFLNNYAIEINLEDEASLFFIVYAVCLFISRPFTGKLLDLKGDNIVIYPALLMFSLSLLLLSGAQNGFVLLIASMMVALGYGTILSCAQAIAIKRSPKHRVGLATSTFFICFEAGMGMGPLLTGMIVPIVHFRGMYAILAIMVFLTIILYYIVHGKNVSTRMKHNIIQKN